MIIIIYFINFDFKSGINIIGTKLIKPRRKLVELVAEIIYNSPDGVLQVQQIYSALQ